MKTNKETKPICPTVEEKQLTYELCNVYDRFFPWSSKPVPTTLTPDIIDKILGAGKPNKDK